MKEQLVGILLLTIPFNYACKQISKSSVTDSKDQISSVIELPDDQPVPLFDGVSLKGWHTYNRIDSAVKNWIVVDSALVCLGTAKDATGGDLVSDNQYANFELSWEWKIDKSSNSGVMYHVVETPVHPAPYETGPEYQIIDDIGFPEKLEDWQKTGADYAMHVPNNKKKLKPVGQWNTSKIISYYGHTEHWLNGEKILEFEAWSEDWNAKRKAGKWKDFDDYGQAKTGKIALQDHGQKAYYRHISIKLL